MIDILNFVNNFAWIAGNLLVIYIAVAIIAFVCGYFVLFDPGATTAGKFIFRFMLSLVGIILLVIIGTYVDPSPDRNWFTLSEHIEWWRPVMRLVIYIYVSFTITSLAIILALRKWKPQILKSAPEDEHIIKVRNPTEETPIVKD